MSGLVQEGDGSGDDKDSQHTATPLNRPVVDAKTILDETEELLSQSEILWDEMVRIDAEGLQHHREWNRCNRRYLRLQERMVNRTEPLILDINDITQLQDASSLLALDTQRAKVQLTMTKIQNRMLEINAALRKMHMEFVTMLGVQDDPRVARQMQRFAEKEKQLHRMRKELGEKLLKRALGRD
ncbi:hypothetical protein QM012_003743 [Aureobasidium pullulans]|uniref:Nucleoporin Nup54 alpha-helical domain-containing protein n=1 Tax=Aureobasidium pullulans TaxID=5580 RepID=A0ABR0T7S5_AURPU